MYIWQLRAEVFRRFLKPIKIISWSAAGGMLLLLFILPMNEPERIRMGALLIAVVSFLAYFYHFLLPRRGIRPWMHYAVILVDGAFITIAYTVLGKYHVTLTPLYVLLILLSGMLAGKRAVWLAASLSFLGSIVVHQLYDTSVQQQTISQILLILIFSMTAVVGEALGDALTKQIEESKQKNENLSLLLDASLVVTSSLDLQNTLPRLAEKIVYSLPVSYARIDLLEGDTLVCYGRAGYRFPAVAHQKQGAALKIAELPWCRQAVKSRRTVQTAVDDIKNPESILAFYSFFPDEINHASFVPLVVAQKVVGLISVGEARQPDREAFSRQKLDFLETLANQISVVIDNASLHQAERRKSRRLEVLNEIGRAIGSTIEMNELLEKLYTLLIQVLPADTYYVGLLDAEREVIDLLLLIYEGERYTGKQLSMKQGFAAYVIREQKPLLIQHMSGQWDHLPVKPVVIGQEKHSESWLGVPMLTGSHFRGILAVASYTPFAFTEEDRSLLESVAYQAALALDNARHHREVEERSRRDSLTGACNHGYFLALLHQMTEHAIANDEPLALIMLDVDYFKEYNDTYGHLIGDDVLCLVVRTIQQSIRSMDVIGRWGGEEFGVILSNTTLEEACETARRINDQLSKSEILDVDGVRLPAPTISQGIAMLPLHTQDAQELVEKADQALYLAKAAGRDQIRVFEEKIAC